MNREEKQAIKILKSFEPIDLFEGAIYLQALEKLTNLIEKLQKENKELKNDISNMYDEEVVISIMCDEFNLSKNEALRVLRGE